MWKLIEVYAQNICSFKELHFKPEQGVTTLIFGDNRDNDSQRSNGSGKSALIECIALGITGVPLRKIKTEEIINDTSDECCIELLLANSINREELFITRKIFRKGSSEVTCHIKRKGESFPGEGIQTSVDAYNKFVLEKLGLTKDEVYNNFILSKHKYQDFLSSSDRDKKEIINRFSNGNMVDEAIERIKEDKTPYQELIQKVDLELAGITGRMEMLQEQIEKEENNSGERVKSKQQKISNLENNIIEKRALIRGKKEGLTRLDAELEKIRETDRHIESLENGAYSMEEYLAGVIKYIPQISNTPLTDWKTLIQAKKDKITNAERELKNWDSVFKEAEIKVNETTKTHKELCLKQEAFLVDCDVKTQSFDTKLKRLENEFIRINSEIDEIKIIRRSLSEVIENLKNKLAGSITCPQCGFEFIIADEGFDVQAGKEELVCIEGKYLTTSSRIDHLTGMIDTTEAIQNRTREEKRELVNLKNEWADKVKQTEREVNNAIHAFETAKGSQNRLIETVNRLQADVEGIVRQIFDEAFELIDEAYRRNERQIKSLQDDIKALEGSIEGYENTIEELKQESGKDILLSLKKSVKEYQDKSSHILKKKLQTEEELRTLTEQEQNFAEFKTYLANTKIEALSTITNEFLEDIGSDIRIKFLGYTVLKSGKVREKISVSLIRSGLDSGSFGKFSAGEAARVNLATILAMQKLINGNCDMDKGLDLLVLDEILEAVDEDGLASMFEALNKLKITSLVVSHGNIAESYPYKIKIVKENGESGIEI